MQYIETSDNNCFRQNIALPTADKIRVFANRPINELLKENKDLLVFPNELAKELSSKPENEICQLRYTSDSAYLGTGNMMGVVGLDEVGLRIRSRFDTDKGDYLLHYMLQKVLSIHLFDFKVESGEEDVFDFRWYLLPYLLKRALQQGIYKTYRTFQKNDSNVKGRIDITRHLNTNLPFSGNIAYSTREKSADNDLTQLIRHTLELAKTSKIGRLVLSVDTEMIDACRVIQTCTPSYNLQDRQKVMSAHLRAFAHPYYTAYAPLRKLCLQLLRHEKLSYASAKEKVYGILFDGAWLWEEYLNTVLKSAGFIHPDNLRRTGGIYLFKNNTHIRFPDFHKEGVVLDAKYKHVRYGVDRDDLHQLVTYMHLLDAATGYLIYPVESGEKTESCLVGELQGMGGTIHTLSVHIPSCSSFSDFSSEMLEVEKEVVRCLS